MIYFLEAVINRLLYRHAEKNATRELLYRAFAVVLRRPCRRLFLHTVGVVYQGARFAGRRPRLRMRAAVDCESFQVKNSIDIYAISIV